MELLPVDFFEVEVTENETLTPDLLNEEQVAKYETLTPDLPNEEAEVTKHEGRGGSLI